MNGCPSFITNEIGWRYECTLEPGHRFRHVAYMTGGGVAASWADPEPSRRAVSR